MQILKTTCLLLLSIIFFLLNPKLLYAAFALPHLVYELLWSEIRWIMPQWGKLWYVVRLSCQFSRAPLLSYGTGPDSCPVVFIREIQRRERWVPRKRVQGEMGSVGRSEKKSASEASGSPLALDYTRLSRPKPNREPVRGLWDGSRAAVYHMKTTADESGIGPNGHEWLTWMAWTNNRNDASRPKAITVVTTTARYDSLRELLHLPHDNCHIQRFIAEV